MNKTAKKVSKPKSVKIPKAVTNPLNRSEKARLADALGESHRLHADVKRELDGLKSTAREVVSEDIDAAETLHGDLWEVTVGAVPSVKVAKKNWIDLVGPERVLELLKGAEIPSAVVAGLSKNELAKVTRVVRRGARPVRVKGV